MTTTDSPSRRVKIDVNLTALTNNLLSVRKARPKARIFCVLKADAYGHGAVECATALAEPNDADVNSNSADGFAVVFPAEAEELRNAEIRQPILVLQGCTSSDDVQRLQALDTWIVVHDETQCALLEQSRSSRPLNIWLKIDTGMGRLGIQPDRIAWVIEKLRHIPYINLMGTLSHLASADDEGNPHTQQQIDSYLKLTEKKMLNPQDSGTPLLKSLSNSAAILAWPNTPCDWVRPGIMLYGSNPLASGKPAITLEPVMQVTTPLISLKHYQRGDGIGYGQTYSCPEAMPVGYAAIGYGDGLPRVLQNATVLIKQKPVPIIGRVSMDSIALDLRNVDAVVGDAVTLWGREIPVEKMASSAGTISYELLCSIKGIRQYHH